MSAALNIGRREVRARLKLRRCTCARCGAETKAYVGLATIEGACGLCGSYELVPSNVRERGPRFSSTPAGGRRGSATA